MKERKFERKDGTEGIEYKPEHGDEIVANTEKVFVSKPRAVIVDRGKDTERAVNIVTYGISATWEGKDIFCKLTEGQKKVLEKTPDLTGKTIVFENYESKNYGTLVGARVK